MLLLLGIPLYFLPIIIAAIRNTVSGVGLLLLNLFLGWTGIGWICALVWACVAETKQQRAHRFWVQQQMARQAAAPFLPPQPSTSLQAGRALGGVVSRFRRDPEPPPSIR